jgi:hypothetical protein
MLCGGLFIGGHACGSEQKRQPARRILKPEPRFSITIELTRKPS